MSISVSRRSARPISVATRLIATISPLALLAPMAAAQDAPANPDTFIDEIIVTGTPLARSVDETITGVSVLTGEDLQRRISATIGETLKGEPGVSSTFFGAGASRPIIRGQGSDRVRVLSNGIGSIDASSASPDHAVAAEPATAERIEVLRGASILRYGSSGSGGVVNVIDGRIPDEVPDGVDAALRIGASSVDEGREVAGALNTGAGNIALHLSGTWRRAEDYRIPDFAESEGLRALEEAEEEEEEGHSEEEEEEIRDRLPNSFAESKSGSAGLSFVGDRGFFGVAVHRFESDYGIPGGHGHEEGHDHEDEDEEHEGEDHDEEEGEEEEENVTIGLRQTRVDVNGAIEMDGFFEKAQIFAGYADYTHTEFEAPGEPGTVFTNEGFEVRAELIQRERGGWSAAHGVQIRERDFSAIGEEAFVPPTLTKQYAAFTFHEFERGDWHFEGTARIEKTDQEDIANNTDLDFTAVSLSAGADVHLSEAVRLGGTVFRTERAPSTEELFSNGPHLATEQFEVGNPNLGLETATGAEIALRHREAGHAVTLNLFYTDYNDFIFDAATGEEEDGLPVFAFTAQDAEFYGFEAKGEVDLYEGAAWQLRADGLIEYVRAKTETGDLPRIPPLGILAGLEAQRGGLTLRGEVDYADSQDRISEFELPTDSYALVGLSGAYAFDERITMRLGIDNLFDTDARQHTSFLKDTVPLPGRNVKLSVTANW